VSKQYRQLTINEAIDTQDYSHDEMENLVFIEKQAADDLAKALESIAQLNNSVPANRTVWPISSRYVAIARQALAKYRGEK
jgi:hypothetical protein